jgi:hypothetical protein
VLSSLLLQLSMLWCCGLLLSAQLHPESSLLVGVRGPTRPGRCSKVLSEAWYKL